MKTLLWIPNTHIKIRPNTYTSTREAETSEFLQFTGGSGETAQWVKVLEISGFNVQADTHTHAQTCTHNT